MRIEDALLAKRLNLCRIFAGVFAWKVRPSDMYL
jgi:hypothetical protein